jgi:hypothetical protein
MAVKIGEGARRSRHPTLRVRVYQQKAFRRYEVVEECATSWSAELPGNVRYQCGLPVPLEGPGPKRVPILNSKQPVLIHLRDMQGNQDPKLH